jgi:hypothetical protein
MRMLTSQFAVVNYDSRLPNERKLTAGSGIAFTDGGAGGPLTIESNVVGGGWTEIPAADFNDNPVTAYSLTMNADYRDVLDVQTPVRWQTPIGLVCDSNMEQLDPVTEGLAVLLLTGTAPHIGANTGMLILVVTDGGGGNVNVNVYSRYPTDATSLIAHTTVVFNSTGNKAVTADNASGVGGSITVNVVPAVGDIFFAYWYGWGVVSDIQVASVTWVGNLAGTADGDVTRLWYGPPEKVATIKLFAGGSFAGAAPMPTLLHDRGQAVISDLPMCRVVAGEVFATTTAGVKAKLNLVVNTRDPVFRGDDGIEVLADDTWYSAVGDGLEVSLSNIIFPSDTLEFSSEIVADAGNENASGSFTVVLL